MTAIKPPNPGGLGEYKTLSALSRWKIFDNLRRSIVAPGTVALLATAWLAIPETSWIVALAATLLLLVPAAFNAGICLMRKAQTVPLRLHIYTVAADFGWSLVQSCIALATLAFEAVQSADAIARTFYRLSFSRKHLLEWQTASDAEQFAATTLWGHYSEMRSSVIATLGLGGAVMYFAPAAAAAALPFLMLWFAAPMIVWLLSQPLAEHQETLTPENEIFLREVARRTWRFFDVFVNAEEHWLPPDNYQQSPRPAIASRTSPTNMGAALTSTLAAFDFGFISLARLQQRLSATLKTLTSLERYQGHPLNWYDTRTLQPLLPRYVSTVDSGNLLGSLLTLRGGLAELQNARLLPDPKQGIAGLADTLRCLSSALQVNPPHDAPRRAEAQRRIQTVERLRLLALQPRVAPLDVLKLGARLEQLREIESAMQALHAELSQGLSGAEIAVWSGEVLRHIDDLRSCILYFAPWLALDAGTFPSALLCLESGKLFERGCSLKSIIAWDDEIGVKSLERAPDAAGQASALREAIRTGAVRARQMLAEIAVASKQCADLCEMKFEFLYDRTHKLLVIGYNVTDHRLDTSFYDLLASEARLASYICVAQNQLPVEHWFCLGRKLTTTGGGAALVSWSGSIFEYLMPNLLLPSYAGSLLDSTCRAVVERQIEYGASNGIPWGISESGFNARDMQQNYQYRAFGVPGLGFKRGLSEDLVVAPYATVMALLVVPARASENLRALQRLGTLGEYGFFEALDFTPARVMDGQRCAVVESHMAHHQGMIMLSLAHRLLNQPMQRRFFADPQMKSADLLLQERLPGAAMPIYPHSAEEEHRDKKLEQNGRSIREFHTQKTQGPEVQLLSNGRYHVMVSNSGAGYSRWKDLAVTRWREDGTRDDWGQFCFIRDLQSRRFWSAAHQPMLQPGDDGHVIFRHSNAEFKMARNGVVSQMSICVSPEDDVEVRRLKLCNETSRPRRLEITTYAEVVLNTQSADASHPAFSNLFVQTEVLKDLGALLCTRRPRQPNDATPWLFHQATVKGGVFGVMSFETDRARFIGRGRTLCDALAFQSGGSLSNTAGSVLDPIFSVRLTLELEPNESVELSLVTGVAESREAALALSAKFKDHRFCERAFEMAWTHSKVVLNQLNATEAEAQAFAELAAPILYANAAHRAPPGILARNQRGQSGLWDHGISGDFPIVLLRVSDVAGVELWRESLRAHEYLRMKGLFFDLVCWNDDASNYRQVLHDELVGAVSNGSEAALLNKPGGVFVRRGDQILEEDRVLLQTVARVILLEGRGRLEDQMDRHASPEPRSPKFVPTRLAPPIPMAMARKAGAPVAPELKFFNGLGGFSPDGREYVIRLAAGQATPAPWCNVIANSTFGTIVSESGGGYTWAENAHEYRLTPWHNDALTDAGGECFYIRDEETGRFWSPTPRPARGAGAYAVRHGFGYSVFETLNESIHTELTVFVAQDAPVKLIVLTMRNDSNEPRRLSATAYWEWVLGEQRQNNAMHVVTESDVRTGAILARNAYNADFRSRVAFCATGDRTRTATCDRIEFLGRNGTLESPAAMRRVRLSGRNGAGLDPCSALQVRVELEPGQQRKIVFMLGAAASAGEALGIVQRFQQVDAAERALAQAQAHWRRMFDTLQVETPDPALDLLLNGWLLYQVLSCRIWARSGYYQSGGAYGFRDQLQDSMALTHAAPELAREHLLRCAARQFEEGDVQHWWHPPAGRGVRTRFSDDYLWLPYALSRYVLTLGDTGILSERVHYIAGRALQPSQKEAYYDLPTHSEKSATLYEHARLSIERALQHMGQHGLPLMGCGDWNDGMNFVGIHGKGESVWLAFFLYDVLKQFGEVARRAGDFEMRERCEDAAETLQAHIREHAWDGAWYLRAFFDDGTPLGSARNPECQIDSLPQSWSVLSKAGDARRSQQAMNAVEARLVRKDQGLIRLFDPPFDHSTLNPGYIKAYVPGVRENGGQYTHGAIWAVMAMAELGETERAWELMRLLNPVRHGNTPAGIETYKVEPYVIAADVYAVAPHTGRGGWTWYTGSAGWFYRLGMETLLGIEREASELTIRPRLPKDWNGFAFRYHYRDTLYKVRVEATEHEACVILDGNNLPKTGRIPLIDDRLEHNVIVKVPRSASIDAPSKLDPRPSVAPALLLAGE